VVLNPDRSARPARAFVAAELPANVRADLAAAARELSRPGADVRWTAAENLHLTLRFLGLSSPEVIRTLVEGLAHRLAQETPPAVTLAGLGAFPDAGAPKVLWAGVAGGADDLVRLAACTEDAALEAGFPPEERPFMPHVTIGRVRSPQGLEGLRTALVAARFGPSGPFPVRHLTLFESLPGPAGAVYRPLARFPLATGSVV